MNAESFSKIVEIVAEVFEGVAFNLRLNRMSIREAFGSQLYSTRMPGSISQKKPVKQAELEVLTAEAFISCIETQLTPNDS
jgi:hypothetical protein